MSEVFRGGNGLHNQSAAIPATVLVAGSAIVITRLLGIVLLANELGYDETINFVHRSARSWDTTLIFIASQVIFFLELRCAFAVLRGRNWGRWGFLAAQLVGVVYMAIATLTGIYPELFSISGENDMHTFGTLLTQKLPDVLILLLLFVPKSSKAFYR